MATRRQGGQDDGRIEGPVEGQRVADAGGGEAVKMRAAAADEDDDPRLRPRRLQALTIRRIGSSDSRSNRAGGRAEPKLSKICTASAPASIWRMR